MNLSIFLQQQSFDVDRLPTRVMYAFLLSVLVTLPMAVWETHWWTLLGLTLVYMTYRQKPQLTLLATFGYIFSTACSAGLYFWGGLAGRLIEHMQLHP
jgi:hypothetical protein